MEHRQLERIKTFLREESGLCFAGRREATLRAQLEGRAARLGMSDLESYAGLLGESAAEQRELYDLVTVNETSFFRNRQQFEDLKTVIIPRLEAERGRPGPESDSIGRTPGRRLRVLSAGCSTGEEPYSLAMTLLEAVRYPLAWDLEIVAGDLSEACLESAAQGRYQEARLKGIPASYRQRYLARDEEGWYFREEVKRLIRFVRLNLARVMEGEAVPGTEPDFAGFDIILCRNVLIYFQPDTQQRLIDTLHGLLAPGGYLLTGDAEPLHLYRHELQTVTEVSSLIYRKKPASPSPFNDSAAPLTGQGLYTASKVSELVAPLPDLAPAAGPEPLSTQFSTQVIEGHLLAIADSSLGCRQQALETLLGRGIDELFPVLEAAVRNNRAADLRNGAMELLVRLGEVAVPRLTALLTDADEEVRNFCAVMLGDIGSLRGVSALIAALKDPEINVRHAAAEALGKIGDHRAARPLLALLDQGFWLQFPAIAALGELGSPEALPRLLELLDDELLFEPVVRALVKIGDPLAIPRLSAFARETDQRKARLAAQAVHSMESAILSQRRAQRALAG